MDDRDASCMVYKSRVASFPKSIVNLSNLGLDRSLSYLFRGNVSESLERYLSELLVLHHKLPFLAVYLPKSTTPP